MNAGVFGDAATSGDGEEVMNIVVGTGLTTSDGVLGVDECNGATIARTEPEESGVGFGSLGIPSTVTPAEEPGNSITLVASSFT